jgi:hypothetical protein
VEALHNGGVVLGNAVAERLGAIRGGNASRVEKILGAPGDAVKRAAVFASGDFCVGLLRLGEGEIAREGDDAAKLGIELLDAAKVDLSEALGSEFALLDPTRELSYRSESDVGIVGGQRAGVEIGADKLIALGAGGLAGEGGMVAREGCEGGFECDSAWAGTALVEGGQIYAPGFCGESAVCG